MRLGRGIFLVPATLALLSTLSPLALGQSYSPKDLSVAVLRDGSVNIQYAVLMVSSPATVELKGFDQSSAETLKVENSFNATVPFSRSGDVIAVDGTPGTILTASYNTFMLTSKNGTIWTLQVDSPVSWSVSFPPNTNITGNSVAPEYIYKGPPLYFVFPAGTVSVRYELSYQPPPQLGFGAIPPAYAVATGLAVLAGSSSFVIYRRYQWRLKGRRLVAKHQTLNKEEKQILLFLSKSRGRAFETEVARALDLSRTSAWRHVRNLEDQGLVVTEKLGLQNLVKLKP